MGSRRVHVVMAAEDQARYRAAATREGLNLSEWLRAAAEQRLDTHPARRLDTVADLESFFADLDAVHTERGDDREPDWHLHAGEVDDERTSAANPPA